MNLIKKLIFGFTCILNAYCPIHDQDLMYKRCLGCEKDKEAARKARLAELLEEHIKSEFGKRG